MNNGIKIKANPYVWPSNDNVRLNELAIIVIDMQNDYCSAGCYMDKAGFDINLLRKPINNIKTVLENSRKSGIKIIYTRHGELNVEYNALSASAKNTKCWEIIDELKPYESDKIFDKSTTSAFNSSDIDMYLKTQKINYLVFCGNTIDCCVHSTLRSANDLGYKCLLLQDCCGAVNDNLFKWSIESVVIENGVFGAVTDSISFIKGIKVIRDTCE